MNITTEALEAHNTFRASVNDCPLEDLLIEGDALTINVIKEWKFTGLNNIDLLNFLQERKRNSQRTDIIFCNELAL